MSELREDIFSRLNTVIEDWRVDRAESLGLLTEKVEAVRSSFEKLVTVKDDAGAIRTSQEELVRLTAAVATHDESAEGLTSRITALESEVGALEGQLADGEAAKNQLQEELAGLREALAASRSELVAKETVFAETITGLEESIADERAQREEVARVLEALQARDDAGHITTLETTLEETRAALAAAEASAADARADATRVATLEEELETMRAALAAAEASAVDADADATRVLRLEAELESVRAALAMAEASAAEADDATTVAEDEAVAPVSPKAAPPVPLEIDAFDGQGHKKRMGAILVESGIMTEAQLKDILDDQKVDTQRRFGSFVVEQGYANEEIVARILAAQSRLPFLELGPSDVDPEAATCISAHLAGLHRCIPVRREAGHLVVAMANPLDLIALEDIELVAKCPVAPVVAAPQRIDEAIARFLPDM